MLYFNILYMLRLYGSVIYPVHFQQYQTPSHYISMSNVSNNPQFYNNHYSYGLVNRRVKTMLKKNNSHYSLKWIIIYCIALIAVLICSYFDYKQHRQIATIASVIFCFIIYIIIIPIDMHSYFSVVSMILIIGLLTIFRLIAIGHVLQNQQHQTFTLLKNLNLLSYLVLHIFIAILCVFISLILLILNYIRSFITILNVLFCIAQIGSVMLLIVINHIDMEKYSDQLHDINKINEFFIKNHKVISSTLEKIKIILGCL